MKKELQKEKFQIGSSAVKLAMLELINAESRCGYQLAKTLRETDEALDVQYGALYPLLQRMERAGVIKGHWQDGRGAHGRHVYEITATGKKLLADSRATWSRIIKSIRSLETRKTRKAA